MAIDDETDDRIVNAFEYMRSKLGLSKKLTLVLFVVEDEGRGDILSYIDGDVAPRAEKAAYRCIGSRANRGIVKKQT